MGSREGGARWCPIMLGKCGGKLTEAGAAQETWHLLYSCRLGPMILTQVCVFKFPIYFLFERILLEATTTRLRVCSGCDKKSGSRFARKSHARKRPCCRACRRADNPMPARETEAIILKTFPLGEADRLVSFLARSGGRLRGVAAGARRLKNRFGSTLELLSHVEMTYTEREAAEAMFRLILLTAREIERRRDWRLPLSYFAFWTVRLGGWLPRFDRCSQCGTPFGGKPAFYDARHSGLFCEKCRRSGMKSLQLGARNLAERFTGERLDLIVLEKPMQESARELREASLAWIEHHTERRLASRELLETT